MMEKKNEYYLFKEYLLLVCGCILSSFVFFNSFFVLFVFDFEI